MKRPYLKTSLSYGLSLAMLLQPFLSKQVFAQENSNETVTPPAAEINPMGKPESAIKNNPFMTLLATTPAPTGGAASNANNFKMPASVSVNERTGALTMQLPVTSIETINDFSVDLTLQYEQGSMGLLGLPKGWTYAWMSYISPADGNNGRRIHMTGGSSYEIKSDWKRNDPNNTQNKDYVSGLKYYYLNDLKFQDFDTNQTLILESEQVKYSSTLTTGIGPLMPNGMLTQYFDSSGLMVAMQDKNKNYMLFTYDWIDPNAPHSGSFGAKEKRLTSIVDGSGLEYKFAYNTSSGKSWQLTLPNGKTFSFNGSTDQINSFTNPLNKTTFFKYLAAPASTEVDLASGGIIRAYFGNMTACSVTGTGACAAEIQIPVVSSIQSQSSADDPKPITVSYQYDANYNFTGYPKFSATTGNDELSQAQDVPTRLSYTYAVTTNNGITKTKKRFNFLHLEVGSDTQTENGRLVSETANNYTAEGLSPDQQCSTIFSGTTDAAKARTFASYDNLPANYQIPKDVCSLVYDNDGNSVQHWKHMNYDNYGKPWHTVESQLQRDQAGNLNGTSKTLNEVYSFYDVTNKKQITDEIDKTVQDSDPHKVIRTVSTIDPFGNVILEERGFVAYDPGFYEALTLENITKQNMASNGFISNETAKKTVYVYTNDSNSPVINGRKLHMLLSKVVSFGDSNVHDNSPVLQITRHAYTQSDNQITVSTSVGDGAKMITSSKVIDINTGLVMKEISPLGKTKSYTYDALGRTTSETSPSGIKTTIQYLDNPNNDGDNVVITTQPGPYITQEHRDGMGREAFTTDNRANKELIRKTYNALNQLQSETDVYGKKMIHIYDDQGREWKKKDGIGNVKMYGYDAKNQIKSTCMNGYLVKIDYLDEKQNVIASTDYPGDPLTDKTVCPTVSKLDTNATAQKASITYNGFGQVSSMIKVAPGGSVIATIWDFKYDIDGNKTHQMWKGFDVIVVETNWKYDLFGNELTKKIAYTPQGAKEIQNGTADVKTHDAFGRLIQETNPLGQFKFYTYDDDGNKLTAQDYSKNVFTYAYDDDGKIIKKSFNNKKTNANGEVVTYPTTYTYAYDTTTGKQTSVSRSDDGTTVDSISYAYNQFGDLTKITYNSGKSIAYEYDDYGRVSKSIDIQGDANGTVYVYNDPTNTALDPTALASATKGSDTVTYTYIQDPTDLNNGQMASFTTGGVKTEYTYYGPYNGTNNSSDLKNAPNNFGNIKEVKVTNAGNGSLIQDIVYNSHDAIGNITSVSYSDAAKKDPNTNFTDEYTYNSLNQLILAKHINDPAKTTWTVTRYVHNANGNVTQTRITDQNGKFVSGKIFTFDDDNKITSIADATN